MGHPESPATLPLLPRLFYVARRKKDFGRDQPTLASPLLSGTALLFFFFFFSHPTTLTHAHAHAHTRAHAQSLAHAHGHAHAVARTHAHALANARAHGTYIYITWGPRDRPVVEIGWCQAYVYIYVQRYVSTSLCRAIIPLWKSAGVQRRYIYSKTLASRLRAQ